MNKSLLTDLVKLLGGFLLIWVVGILVVELLPKNFTDGWFDGTERIGLSIEQEEKLGEAMLDMVLAGHTLAESERFDSAFSVIQSRLLSQVDSSAYNYKFYLVDDPMVNALTFPGANIVVFTGLVDFCESPEQLSAVLAHEIGHVEEQHVVDKLVAEIGMSILIGVITGGDATVMHDIYKTLASSYFSRLQEQDADEFGMKLLLDSGIDPLALAEFFRKLSEEKADYGEYLEWIMSHPNNDSRVAASENFKVPYTFVPDPFSMDWEQLKSSL
ncbi:MAG: M48 family metallopeptidase [Flavobacteriales bacterium]|nr:M48 family metallopeptidase [Flavobacteriales bacterium]